jgi:hypothetical protein
LGPHSVVHDGPMQTTLASRVLRLAAVAPLAGALVAYAACSSDNSNGGSSTTTTSTSQTSTTSGSSSSGSTTSGSTSSSSGSTTSGSTSSSSTSTSAGDAGALTFSQVYTDIIAGHCAGCHHPAVGDAGAGGGFALGKLDMSSVDAGYMNLVGVPAGGTGLPGFEDAGQKVCDTLGDAGLLRVAPGDAGGSLLCNKVNPAGTPPCGDPMPLLAFPLPSDAGLGQDAVFQEIKSWINQGAKP